MAVHGFISRVCKFKKNLYVQVVKCVRTGDWRQCVCVCGATAVSSVSHVPLTAKSCSLPWFNILTKIAAGDMCAVLKGRIWKLYFFGCFLALMIMKCLFCLFKGLTVTKTSHSYSSGEEQSTKILPPATSRHPHPFPCRGEGWTTCVIITMMPHTHLISILWLHLSPPHHLGWHFFINSKKFQTGEHIVSRRLILSEHI